MKLHILTHGSDNQKDLCTENIEYRPIRLRKRNLQYLPFGKVNLIRRFPTSYNISLFPVISYYKTNHWQKSLGGSGVNIVWFNYVLSIDFTWFKNWKLKLKFEKQYK